MEGRSQLRLRTVGIVVLLLIVLIVVFSSYTIVKPGYRGVVVMLGRVEETALVEGFHLIIPPVVRTVIQVDVRTKKFEVDTEAASADLQAMTLTGVLNYHLDPTNVGRLYQEVGLGFENIIIVPAVQEAIKAATAQFKIDRILIDRAELKANIQGDLQRRLAANHIIVDQFSIANVEFSQEFNNAIERKQVAEQTALQKQYELQGAQKDVEIALARADGNKKAAIIAAEGQAEARILEAQAEAKALQLIADQLRDNDALIRYEWARRLAPSVKTVLLPTGQDIILGADSLVAGAGGQ